MRTSRDPGTARSRPLSVAATLAGILLLSACGERGHPVRVSDGSVERGKSLTEQYQCSACHVIPGVAGPVGGAGPSLAHFGRSSYIAGSIPNLPPNLQAWIVDPPALKPDTPMPDMGVSPDDARDIAAYLYTLR